jgi:AmmeMemoRadiSam system protein B
MVTAERPQLRPFLDLARDEGDPRYVFLFDRLKLSPVSCRLPAGVLTWLPLLDGKHTLCDIQSAAVRQAGGQLVPVQVFSDLVERLDEALFLEGPRFRERLAGPVREPSCIGCYEGEPDALRRQLRGLFTAARGPGLPHRSAPSRRLRAAVIPHIDFRRGGATFAWGFKEVFEETDASLFVIIGTSHYTAHRFTLTRKNFKTPLGVVPTDQPYVDRLVAYYGDGLFDGELAHLPEHSIELEVVFLQYLYEGRRPIRIVPLLAGSFQDGVETGTLPRSLPDVARMIETLRRAEAETPEPICYIISGDLAHLGPDFGDPAPVDGPLLAHSRAQDGKLCAAAEAVDLNRYFGIIADEADNRRICGLPPTYTLLEAVRPRGGKLLHYDQYVHPQGAQSVSFASMAFYR